ncbi:hypothetical protein LFM09_25295 [Lentzea alba]|uniref:hypothetical protein n=1 Tax=Lentzea alba TaxID=2714351 RepID=UPI0039BF6958
MGDLLKDLARTRPSTPDVDPERMERDLARIVSLPRSSYRREWAGAPSFRRLLPLLVAAAVVALAVVAVPSQPPAQMGKGPEKWRVLSRVTSLMVVGDPANPYVVRFASESDKWLAAEGQTTISQVSGTVMPFGPADDEKWKAAGSPSRAPQVGGNHDVRIGPMKPAVRKTNYPDFEIAPGDQMRFDELAKLPATPSALMAKLADLNSDPRQSEVDRRYRMALLAMGMMAANVTVEQRFAAYEVLLGLFVRNVEKVTLPNTREGIVGVVPSPKTFQFKDVETQLVLDPDTRMPIMRRDVITTPQHGLAAGTSISEEEFVLLEASNSDPMLPTGVVVNGEVESPIIER